ncbi:MAG: UbiD family decarboxylase [Candidatus Binataceae bacterium]|nr:UbiD family decarboxylase [Candidatus Binataceae bacterium]
MAVKKTELGTGFGCPADLREYLEVLERAGELRRVKAEVDWQYEAGAISRLVNERRGPAPLFENVKDYPGQQIAAVLMGPSKPALHARIALALGLDKNTPTLDLIEIVRARLKTPCDPVVVRKEQAACKEVVLTGKDIDLNKFAFPWIKETLDGGRYLGTWDIVALRDPDTGWLNWATYRCMVKDGNHFAILLMPAAQHGGAILRKYEAMGKPMPIAIMIGANPACHLAAVTAMDHGVAEVSAAGGLMGSPIPIVRCETSDLEVAASAEMVIEAEILPGDRVDEGPFGEYTGHSAHREKCPQARVTCITHRKNPIHTMANMGKPWDDAAANMSVMTPAQAKNRLEAHGLAVKAVYTLPPDVMVVSLKSGPGLQQRVVSTLTSVPRLAMRGIVFVDEDVDVTDVEDVWWAIASRMNPENFDTIKGIGANTLYPWLTPEMRERKQLPFFIIDATFPYHWPQEYRDAHTKVSDFKHGWTEETKRKVLARWKEYGYGDL